MKFEPLVGIRYMMSRKRNRFLSVITIISLVGVILGVMALVTVLAVMSGFENELRKKILGNNSHIYLMSSFGDFSEGEVKAVMEKLPKIPNVIGVSPTVTGEAFLLGANRFSSGVMVKGVDPTNVESVLLIQKYIQEGSLEDLRDAGSNEYPRVLIGHTLSERLQLPVGAVATVILPQGEITPFGMTPKIRKLRVAGTFQTGISEFDERFMYCHIKTAQHLFDMDSRVQFFEIKVKNLGMTKQTGRAIQEAFADERYITRDWMDSNSDFFSALKLEKTVMFIILTMIVIVAAFNIMATLIMIVKEKNHDIAILKSFGARNGSIMKIFMTQGTLIGAVGTAIGVIAGLGLCFVLDHYVHYPLNPNVYMIDSLPVEVRALDVVLVSLSALAISVLATFYPSWRAAQLDPVEGLRWE